MQSKHFFVVTKTFFGGVSCHFGGGWDYDCLVIDCDYDWCVSRVFYRS